MPGTLLNVALLNLASSDETLRAAAYKLIHELRQFFKYELASQIFKVSSELERDDPGKANVLISGTIDSVQFFAFCPQHQQIPSYLRAAAHS